MNREEFLKDNNRVEEQVMRDEGGEYIITDDCEMEMEEGSISIVKGRKWYLPEQFQTHVDNIS